tara:strand:- start:3584 stop:4648 length:1065 start_codon:yes stop_codon:yes gene_type:complete
MKVSKKYLAKIIAEEVEKALQENIVVDKADGTPLVWKLARDSRDVVSLKDEPTYKHPEGNFHFYFRWRTILELSEETPPPKGGKTPQVLIIYLFPFDEPTKRKYPKGAFQIRARVYTADGKTNIQSGLSQTWDQAYGRFLDKLKQAGYLPAPVEKHNLSSTLPGKQRMPRPIAKRMKELFGEKEQKPSPEKTTSQEPGADAKKTAAAQGSGADKAMLKKKFIRAKRIQPRAIRKIRNVGIKTWADVKRYMIDAGIREFKNLGRDAVYDRSTFNAIYKFQQRAFPGKAKEHDGIVGGRTWAKIQSLMPDEGESDAPADATAQANKPKSKLRPVERGSGVVSKTVTKGNLTKPASK